MLTTSRVLTIVGLCLEFISVFWTIRKLFYGYYKRIDEMAGTFQQKITKNKKEGTVILILLTIGLILQGIGTLY